MVKYLASEAAWEAEYQQGVWDRLDGVGEHGRFVEFATQVRKHAAADSPTRVVDLGCGHANAWIYLREIGLPIAYLGVDVSPAALAVARKRFGDEIRLEQADINVYDVQSADWVVMAECLYYLPDPIRVVTDVLRQEASRTRVFATLFRPRPGTHEAFVVDGVLASLKDRFHVVREATVKEGAHRWSCLTLTLHP